MTKIKDIYANTIDNLVMIGFALIALAGIPLFIVHVFVSFTN